MTRLVGLAVALLLTGCGPSVLRCLNDRDCVGDGRCDLQRGVCVAGSGGGAGGGSGGGGASTCVPACSSSTECVGTRCEPRYAALTVTAPAKAPRTGFTVSAELALSPQRSPADPAELAFSVVGAAMIDDAGNPITSLRRVGAGRYEAAGSLIAGEGTWTLRAEHSDAGLEGTRAVTVDLSAPRGEVWLSALPPRAGDAGFLAASPTAPGAWRRDEIVTVLVDTEDRDAVSASAELHAGAGAVQRFGAFDAGCVSRFDGGRCFAQSIELWRHPMPAYEATAVLEARLSDDVGNAAALDGGAITVTRFKWQRTVPGVLYTLALTPGGHVITYVVPPSPAMYAVLSSWTPAGDVRWSQPSDGFNGHVMVGSVGADPMVYVAEVDQQQLRLSGWPSGAPGSGPMVNRIPLVGDVNAVGAPLLFTRADEIVYVPVRHSSTLALYAWNRGTAATHGIDAGAAFGANLRNAVSDNRSIMVPVMNNAFTVSTVQRYDVAFAAGFPPALGVLLGYPGSVVSSAFPLSENLYITAVTDGGRPSQIYGGPTLPLMGAGLVAGATAYYASEVFVPAPAVATLCRVPFATMSAACADLHSYTAPIVGAGDLLYVPTLDNVATQMGFRVAAVDATTLARLWETPLKVNGYNARVMSLDCSRGAAGAPLAGRPGVLYASTLVIGTPTSSAVEAIIVDSPGLDPNAVWPMEKHDPRSTNNLATSLTPFSCP